MTVQISAWADGRRRLRLLLLLLSRLRRLRRLLADADLRERYGSAARARIGRHFSIAGEGDAINSVYGRLWEAT